MGTGIPSVESAGADILGFQNPARLSRAEFRVCMLLAQGAGNAAICAALSLSESTVRAHIRTVCAKTGVADREELVARLGQGQTPAIAASHPGRDQGGDARVA